MIYEQRAVKGKKRTNNKLLQIFSLVEKGYKQHTASVCNVIEISIVFLSKSLSAR